MRAKCEKLGGILIINILVISPERLQLGKALRMAVDTLQ